MDGLLHLLSFTSAYVFVQINVASKGFVKGGNLLAADYVLLCDHIPCCIHHPCLSAETPRHGSHLLALECDGTRCSILSLLECNTLLIGAVAVVLPWSCRFPTTNESMPCRLVPSFWFNGSQFSSF